MLQTMPLRRFHFQMRFLPFVLNAGKKTKDFGLFILLIMHCRYFNNHNQRVIQVCFFPHIGNSPDKTIVRLISSLERATSSSRFYSHRIWQHVENVSQIHNVNINYIYHTQWQIPCFPHMKVGYQKISHSLPGQLLLFFSTKYLYEKKYGSYLFCLISAACWGSQSRKGYCKWAVFCVLAVIRLGFCYIPNFVIVIYRHYKENLTKPALCLSRPKGLKALQNTVHGYVYVTAFWLPHFRTIRKYHRLLMVLLITYNCLWWSPVNGKYK